MDIGSQKIIRTLNVNGYQAYFVGGCVRDYLMNHPPKDIDICTSALPKQVMACFDNTIPTGIDYGTVTVLIEGMGYEVTTFRAETGYDGRRPKVVRFSTDLYEDLSRRDFTINAMAMSLSGEVIDPYGGQADLKQACLRFVGVPMDRLLEDRLRLLRYVRFLTRLGFKSAHESEELTWQLDISQLSYERVQQELNEMLLIDKPSEAIRYLHRLGLLGQIMPEILPAIGFDQRHPAHTEDVFSHTLSVLDGCPKDLAVRLAALCHDLGKPQTFTMDEAGCGHFYGHPKHSVILAEGFLSRLKYSSQIKETVLILTAEHMRTYAQPTKAMAKRLIRQVGMARLEQFFSLQLADTKACAGDRSGFVNEIHAMKGLCETVLLDQEAFSLKDLKINGNDLMRLGLGGKAVGAMLNQLLEAVIDEKLENEQGALLQYVKNSLDR